MCPCTLSEELRMPTSCNVMQPQRDYDNRQKKYLTHEMLQKKKTMSLPNQQLSYIASPVVRQYDSLLSSLLLGRCVLFVLGIRKV
jgi:hypothetical protein